MLRIGLIVLAMMVGILAGCQAGDPETQLTGAEGRKVQLQRILNARYENPEAHFELGSIFHDEGRYERAEFHYGVAIGFDPGHRQAQAAMVKLMLDRGDAQRAQNVADVYIKQASMSADALMALGRAFHREEMHTFALRCYNQATAQNPDSAPILKQLGYFYLRQDDAVRAEQYFRRSFEIDPNQPDVAAELGRMGVRVQVPPRKATGVFGPLRGHDDETVK